MVSIKAIRAANNSTSSKSPTAVYVGATSGIGLAGIETLLQKTTSPTVFIVGRSKSTFAPTLANLQKINESAKLTFIEAQVSLLQEVLRVCAIIASQESSLDILWLSQGGLSLSAHELTSEGLYTDFAIQYYSRILFMYKLLPLLNKSSDARVISILAVGEEGSIITSDIGLTDPKNDSFFPAMKQGVSMMSLSMRELSLMNPQISFLHTFPGLVSTPVHEKWASTITGYLIPLRWLVRWVFIPVRDLFGMSAEDAGQTGYFEVTDGRFAARGEGNFFRLMDDAEEAKKSAILDKYIEDGTGTMVWEHTLAVFEKVVGL